MIKNKFSFDYTILDDSNLSIEAESYWTFLFSKKLIFTGDLINTRLYNYQDFNIDKENDEDIISKVNTKFVKLQTLEKL